MVFVVKVLSVAAYDLSVFSSSHRDEHEVGEAERSGKLTSGLVWLSVGA
jgi:hypothetical protein